MGLGICNVQACLSMACLAALKPLTFSFPSPASGYLKVRWLWPYSSMAARLSSSKSSAYKEDSEHSVLLLGRRAWVICVSIAGGKDRE